MLEKIAPQEAYRRVQAGEADLIDIRETQEYAEVSVPGARLAPLSIIAKHPLRAACAPEQPLIFTCRSGKRTEKNAELLERLAGRGASMLEGGVDAWEKAGLPVERTPGPLPMFRQIQIGAGGLVLLGVLGSAVWHPMFWLSALVGAGLVFAGLTGYCGLGMLLAKMPWNQKK